MIVPKENVFLCVCRKYKVVFLNDLAHAQWLFQEPLAIKKINEKI